MNSRRINEIIIIWIYFSVFGEDDGSGCVFIFIVMRVRVRAGSKEQQILYANYKNTSTFENLQHI